MIGSSSLPQDWTLATLEDVADATLGKTPRRADYRDSGRYRIVKYRDLKSGILDFGETQDAYVADDPSVLKGLRELKERDVLIGASGHDGSSVGRKLALVDQLPHDEPVFFVGELFRIRSRSTETDPRWFLHYFSSEAGYRALQSAVTGGHLTNGRARQIVIPIPPPEIQKRLSDLLDSVRRGQLSSSSHLDMARAVIERFRQAVLAAACSGRLTSNWRAGAGVEAASVSLERKRQADRERLGEKYREPLLPDPSKLPKIPEEWCWAVLPELGELGRGKSKHRPRNDPTLYGGDYPFIQTGDVARSGGRIVDHTQTYNEAGLAQSRLWPERTVCITIAANIADSALLTYPACFPDSVVGLVADEAVALPEYVELFVRTARRDLAAFAPATAQANINLAILSELAVALPPMAEQREITQRAATMFDLGDHLLARLERATRHVDRSSQAVLAKAFRGELTLMRSNGDGASL